ncbi:hypothetical protein BJX76DRAFT_317441 [Aspergillus varians]
MEDSKVPRALRSNTSLPAYTTFLQIRNAILASTDSQYLVFDAIPPSIGPAVFDDLLEDPDIENLMPRMTYNSHENIVTACIMPTKIHDVPQMWLSKELTEMRVVNFLSPNEYRHLDSVVGTALKRLRGPIRGLLPGALIPNTDHLPSIIVESGWSDSWLKLIADMKLWLRGGRPNV